MDGIGQAADLGADGVFVWGTNLIKRSCLQLQNYTTQLLGPYIKQVVDFSKACSQNVCNSHGRCALRNMSSVSAMQTYIDDIVAKYGLTGSSNKLPSLKGRSPYSKWDDGYLKVKYIKDYDNYENDALQEKATNLHDLRNMNMMKKIFDQIVGLYSKDHNINATTFMYKCYCYEGWTGDNCQKRHL